MGEIFCLSRTPVANVMSSFFWLFFQIMKLAHYVLPPLSAFYSKKLPQTKAMCAVRSPSLPKQAVDSAMAGSFCFSRK
jgi:hypothetical protein